MFNIFADATKGAVEGFGNAIANVISKVKADPTQVVTIEGDLQKAALEYQASVIASVNATMQSETKSEHWLSWSWRPLIGYGFVLLLFNNYVLLPYFVKVGLQPIVIPDSVWSAMLVILGASAAGRSFEKWQMNNGNGNGNGGPKT